MAHVTSSCIACVDRVKMLHVTSWDMMLHVALSCLC